MVPAGASGLAAPGQNMIITDWNGNVPEIFNFFPTALSDAGGQMPAVFLEIQSLKVQLVVPLVAGVNVRVKVSAGSPNPADWITLAIWLMLTLQEFDPM